MNLNIKNSANEEYSFKRSEFDELESLAREFGWVGSLQWDEDDSIFLFGHISDDDAAGFAIALEKALPQMEDKSNIPEEHKIYPNRITDEGRILELKRSGVFTTLEKSHGLRPGALSTFSMEQLKYFFSHFGFFGWWHFTDEGEKAYAKLPLIKKLSGRKFLITRLACFMRSGRITFDYS